ncbi:heavy-metal-associated domain-containing protein [Candidatus Peribacteria bacterium]|nr:heavy-metal-associated domain-containing protein [Candidatus Peribacteria bacterium]
MTCSSCAQSVRAALESSLNITAAVVDLSAKTVTITMQAPMEVAALNALLPPKYTLTPLPVPTEALPEKSLRTYWPLVLVVLYIIGGTLHLSWLRGAFLPSAMMMDFMGLFFVGFAFFKLLDLKGFAMSYRSYDILTRRWPVWGYIYPFVELALGLLYLRQIAPLWTSAATVVVMGFSIIGVIQSVRQRRAIKCACLGTGFNLPMSTITIIEDALMILMALWMGFSSL